MDPRVKVAFACIGLTLIAVVTEQASAKVANTISQPLDRETFVSVGDVVVKVTLRESLPNAFGGADIFGRKRDRGFIEVRFMGITDDGRAIFRRRTVDIFSNETTMSRSGMRFGNATITPNGDGATVTGQSYGAPSATVEALPPDTIEFALDLSKSRIITAENFSVEILNADSSGVKFKVNKRP